jgi:hypothetical protein
MTAAGTYRCRSASGPRGNLGGRLRAWQAERSKEFALPLQRPQADFRPGLRGGSVPNEYRGVTAPAVPDRYFVTGPATVWEAIGLRVRTAGALRSLSCRSVRK